MVLLEVDRQLLEFDFIQNEKQKQGMPSSITLGKTLEPCPPLQATEQQIQSDNSISLGH